jgi:DNA polymerase-3 subunit beta
VTATAHTQTEAGLSVRTDRATLLDALCTVGLAVPTRAALPVLSGVLLDGTAEGDLIVSATDYDSAVTVRVPGAAIGTGRLLVEHAELVKLLDALTKGTRKRDADRMPVTITADDPAAPVLSLAGYTVPLDTLPVDDYPTLLAVPPMVASVDRQTFTAETGRVLVAAHTGTVPLPALTGVRLEVTDGAVTLAATDRYRLAVARVPAVTSAVGAGPVGAVVAGRLLATLGKRLTADTVRIGLGVHKASGLPQAAFTCGHVTVITMSVSEDFPRYGSLLPAESTGTVVVDRGRMLTDTRRAAAVLAAKRTRDAVVSVRIRPGGVQVAPALSERADQVTAPGITADTDRIGEPVDYLFNAGLLIDALESFTADTVTAHLTRAVHKPVLFTDTPDGLRDPGAFRHLLMPRRHPDR